MSLFMGCFFSTSPPPPYPRLKMHKDVVARRGLSVPEEWEGMVNLLVTIACTHFPSQGAILGFD